VEQDNMEFKGATLLYTLAGLMTTFAGFSALLLTLRPATGARLSLLDRFLGKTVMTHIFVLTAGALLPALFCALRHSGKVDLARLRCAFRTPDAVSSGHLSAPARKLVGNGPPPAVFAVFVVFGAAVTLAMLGYVLAASNTLPQPTLRR
jgi:hypothetical protein